MVYTAKTIHSGDQAGGVSTKNAQDLESVLVDVDASVDEIDSVLFERKIKLTDEGGYAVSLINKTGAASVRGSLVHASSTTDNAVALQANTYDTFGIIYEAAVAECLATFGEGARPEFQFEEEAFALYGTPVQNGYVRVVVAEHIAVALQWMKDNAMTSENVEIIRVEWQGQDMIEFTDDEGNTIYAEELFQTGVDEEGNPQYLGRMA